MKFSKLTSQLTNFLQTFDTSAAARITHKESVPQQLQALKQANYRDTRKINIKCRVGEIFRNELKHMAKAFESD